MANTINFEPGSEVGEIIIVDGKSWTWDGKKWILTDGSAAISDLPAKVDQLEQDIISLDEEIESIIPSLERGQWEYSESPNVSVEPREGCFYLVKNYAPGQDFALSTFTEEYKEATAVVFNNKQWAEDMSLAKEHQWDTVEVDEMIDLLDKPDPDGLFGKITEVDTDFFDNAVIIAFDKIETLGSPNNNNLSTLTRLKIFKEPTGEIDFFPVGVIMPYVGDYAPRGWLLCQGGAIPQEYTTLRSLVGNNTPNLKGYFLGGAGGSGLQMKTRSSWTTGEPSGLSLSSQTGGSHKHSFSYSGQVDSAGEHTHDMGDIQLLNGSQTPGRLNIGGSGTHTKSAGQHRHAFSVSGQTSQHQGHTHTIESSGWDSVTRPNSYGVNYIIKHD